MSLADELFKLQQLRDSGTITDDEFAAAKAKLLNEDSQSGLNRFFGWGSKPRTDDDQERQTRQLAFVLHLSHFVGYSILPGVGFALPILIWQLLKEHYPGLEVHGRNEVNWLISSFIYSIISGILCLVLIGFPMLLALVGCDIAFHILAAIKANEGVAWKYPWSIQFLKEEN